MVQLTLADISKKISDEVIDRAFRKKTNSSDSVVRVEVSRAAPAGEGLISAVYRIKVTGTRYVTSFVAKGLVKDPLIRNSLPCVKFFQREVFFFSKILPNLIKVQEQTGAKEKFQNCVPVCYDYFSNGSDDYILMEDLAEAGFKAIPDVPTKRDLEVCIRVLAHLHATSMAFKVQKPEVFRELTTELADVYYNELNRPWYKLYLEKAVKIDDVVLKDSKEISSDVYKRFSKLVQGDLYGKLIELSRANGSLPVISHGDAWCSNFLSSKERAVTFDFQILRCASPVTDLSYFIALCSVVCNTKELFNEAVEVYYKSLQYYLSDMKIDAEEVYSLKTLWEEMSNYGKFGLIASLTSIPLMANSRCDIMNSFTTKDSGATVIPLEELWLLQTIEDEIHKKRLINAVCVAADVGLI